jgi:hypothetical protein
MDAADSPARARAHARVTLFVILVLLGLFVVVAAAAVQTARLIDEPSAVDDAVAAEPPAPRPPWRRLVATRHAPSAELFAAPDEDAQRTTIRARWLERRALAFLVVDRAPGWVKVSLPRRPNGSTAWLRAEDVELSTTDYAITVEVGARRIVARYRGTAFLTSPVVVGASATPTPRGSFYVSTRVHMTDATGAYGPWALGLSGHSEALETFHDQPAQVALHGTNHPELLGLAASNGCIRLPNWVSAKLGPRIPLGTPVTIV